MREEWTRLQTLAEERSQVWGILRGLLFRAGGGGGGRKKTISGSSSVLSAGSSSGGGGAGANNLSGGSLVDLSGGLPSDHLRAGESAASFGILEDPSGTAAPATTSRCYTLGAVPKRRNKAANSSNASPRRDPQEGNYDVPRKLSLDHCPGFQFQASVQNGSPACAPTAASSESSSESPASGRGKVVIVEGGGGPVLRKKKTKEVYENVIIEK